MMDLTDRDPSRGLSKFKPDKLFNLAALVSASFDCPAATADINSMGVLRLLESIRNFSSETRFIKHQLRKCSEKLADSTDRKYLLSRSPYGVSKLFSIG